MATNFAVQNGGWASDFSDLFIRKDLLGQGNLWTVGTNSTGQLGDNTIVNKSSPVQTVAAGSNWKQAAIGTNYDIAIKTDGTLWTWGQNNLGQLGDNTITAKSSPVQTVAGGTNWKSAATLFHTAAVKTDGTLWLWGFNGYGRLGDNTAVSKSSPVQTIAGGNTWKQAACGTQTAAIKTDGTLWVWGYNSRGQLGDNTIVDKSSPIQTIAAGTNWKLVACGKYYTGAVKTDGTLWLWGWNNYGQLGDNTITMKSSPVQTVSGGTNWKLVSCGNYHVAAIKTDGTLWTWGKNTSGQLGDNTVTRRSSPVQTVSGGTNWKQASFGTDMSLAIKTDGTLWTWGGNSAGGLGDNTALPKSSPVQTIMGGTNWTQVIGGFSNNAFIADAN